MNEEIAGGLVPVLFSAKSSFTKYLYLCILVVPSDIKRNLQTKHPLTQL
jgi:hypothetical protein